MLSTLLQDPSLPVVGIEEPELTVHPGAIPLLIDFINHGGSLDSKGVYPPIRT
jgi:predicted ATPase